MVTQDLSGMIGRLKEAMERRGMRQEQLAQLSGVSKGAISTLLSGKTKTAPKVDTLLALCGTLQISVSWVITGEGGMADTPIIPLDDGDDPPEGFIAIREYGISFACGASGGDCDGPSYEELNDTEPVTYRLSWLLRHTNSPKECRRFRATGDSMEPLIRDGDSILVDCSEECRLNVGKKAVYAIWYDGALLCKYLSKDMGMLVISSENRTYDTIKLPLSEGNTQFRIIGKVIERSGAI